MTLEQRHSQLIQQGTWEDAMKLGLLAAGVGAALRGGSGLFSLGRRNIGPAAKPAVTAPVTVNIPVDRQEEEEQPIKMGEDAGGWGQWFGDMFTGAANTSPEGWWGYKPSQILGGGAGMYGGWKLADLLMDQRRKAELQGELDAAKRDYELALSGQSKLGRALDELCDRVEKEGSDTLGKGIGLLATLGLLTGAGGAWAGYNFTKARNPATVSQKAKQQYRAEQFRKRPSPIFARPVPLSPSVNEAPASEDEMEGEPLDKVATLGDVGQRLKQDWPIYAGLPVVMGTTMLGARELGRMSAQGLGADEETTDRWLPSRGMSAGVGIGAGLAPVVGELLRAYRKPQLGTIQQALQGFRNKASAAMPKPSPPPKPITPPREAPAPDKPRPS